MTLNLPLPFDADAPGADASVYAPDEHARRQAVDPTRHVVLEASAGTGKTKVLVDRYVSLLRRRVDPGNILAITFTRKAAAEMRERILQELRGGARLSSQDEALWRDLRDRAGEIAISTIDAFCLSLLREFPLEADLDPGFDMADETEVPRLMEEALDRALFFSREIARSDENVRLVFAQLGDAKLRAGLMALLERRIMAEATLGRLLETGPADLTADLASARAVDRLRDIFRSVPCGLERFLEDGPVQHLRYALFARDVRMLWEVAAAPGTPVGSGTVRAALERVRAHFLTKEAKPRKRLSGYGPTDCVSRQAWGRHAEAVAKLAPAVGEAFAAFRRDLNVVLSRGVSRALAIALTEYRRTLEAHAVLDFSELLIRASDLLEQMDEFARSRYRLESRYHHVLVDEFQDTSRAQWNLVSALIRSWGEGLGLTEDAPLPPTIFIVGDRKQSIYGFRDADVAVLEDARHAIDRLRPEGDTRRAISRSFRAVPALLAFTNDLFRAVERVEARKDAFRYDESDKFPIPATIDEAPEALGVLAADSTAACAEAVAAEIQRVTGEATEATVRDRQTGLSRPVRPGDIAILFRSRESHREFGAALDMRNIPTYVYKGLGFFDADEVKDVVSLLRYLAKPGENVRAAAFLRSRFIRLSDPALQALAPQLAAALAAPAAPAMEALTGEDRQVLAQARASVAGWLALVDRLPPADLLERVLAETAYAYEICGPRALQARENLKKVRAMIRRIQNRGYATLGRIAEHLDRLSAGDESNAVIDAVDAVSLMTVHAAKGLEFPIVFVVNLTRGTGGRRPAIRVGDDDGHGQPWVSVGDFQSEADQDTQARDREETKRLLYVAVTRARDRFYLATALKDGRWRPATGSLAEVLPATFGPLFLTACGASTPGRLEWTGESGRVHRFRVCPVPAPAHEQSASLVSPVHRDGRLSDGRADDFSILQDGGAIARIAVTAALASAAVRVPGRVPPGFAQRAEADQALVGTLVHRLLEREAGGSGDAQDLASVMARLSVLVRDDEIVGVHDVDDVVGRAADAYLALRAHPGFASELAGSECWFEVPFALRPEGQQVVLRGSFDCLVKHADGRVTVLEFKTGRPTTEHGLQLDMYVTAARALFPGAAVDGKLLYARPRV